MDDMRLLTEMRSEVPQPDPQRLARIRQRWTQATSPARRGPAVRVKTTWRLAVATGLVVAMGAVGATILGGGFDRSGGAAVREDAAGAEASTTRMSAAQFLLVAAERVQASPADEPRPDQWVYTKTRYVMAASWQRRFAPEVAVDRITENWFKVDGTLFAHTLPSGQLSVGPAVEGDDTSNLSPAEILRKLQSMPTDPDALLRTAYATTDEPAQFYRDAQAFVFLGWIVTVRQALVPARLTAASYRAIALIPSVRLDEDAVDAAGRHGTGLSVATFSGQRFELIVDSESGAYLGHRNLAADGAVLNSAARLGAAVVDQPGQRP